MVDEVGEVGERGEIGVDDEIGVVDGVGEVGELDHPVDHHFGNLGELVQLAENLADFETVWRKLILAETKHPIHS